MALSKTFRNLALKVVLQDRPFGLKQQLMLVSTDNSL